MGPVRFEWGRGGPVRAEWGCGGVGHALGFTLAEEGEAKWGRVGPVRSGSSRVEWGLLGPCEAE